MNDDVLVYPEGRVVGIAADRDVLTAVGRELQARGIEPDRCEVLTGAEAAHAADTDPSTHGLLAGAIRVVQNALGEETPRLAALSQALDAGGHVVLVALADDDQEREADKHAAGRALAAAGATEVAYYGPMAIEEL